MNYKLKNALIFVAIAWPLMMVLAYLLSFTNAFADTNLVAFGLLGLPALFVARLISLQLLGRSST